MNPLPSASLSHNRRAFLREGSLGIGSLALAWLLQQEQAAASPAKLPIAPPRVDLLPRPPHHQPRAKAMISLFMHGGPSHMDLTDPKPELTRLNGTEYPGDIAYSFVNEASKKLLGSRWSFAKHGRCGTEVSELLPGLASIVDDVCLLRGMHTGANGHEVSIRYFHGGIPGVLGRPHMASWLLYGLGSETQNLPAYMVLTDPGGLPVDGVTNWSSGFMPPIYQGTVIRPTEPRILNLDPPPISPEPRSGKTSTCSPRSIASTRSGSPGSPTWSRGSPATSLPPACRPPPATPSTSPRKPGRRWRCMASMKSRRGSMAPAA